MYKFRTTNQFERDYSLCKKRGLNMDLIDKAMKILVRDGRLPGEYQQHKLSGKYSNCWECHIRPDWLMIWKQYDNELIMLFTNTGTHSDLFGK